MGSACVFFDVSPHRAKLSDFNEDLVDFFLNLRNDPDGVIDAFTRLDPTGGEYYQQRSLRPGALSPPARAARFLYLNRFAFNGVYRTNRRGEFNVPRGVRTGALPTSEELRAASSALQSATVIQRDYLTATKEVTKGDFVYLDPPYRNTTRATYGEYGYEAFGSINDVTTLAGELQRLDGIGARVLLSFNDDDEIIASIPDWTIERIDRKRSVAGRASARTALAGEILARNYRVDTDA